MHGIRWNLRAPDREFCANEKEKCKFAIPVSYGSNTCFHSKHI